MYSIALFVVRSCVCCLSFESQDGQLVKIFGIPTCCTLRK